MTHPPTSGELEVLVVDFIREGLIEDAELGPETPFVAAGLDSIHLMELVLFVERCLGFPLPPSVLADENMTSARSLARFAAGVFRKGEAA